MADEKKKPAYTGRRRKPGKADGKKKTYTGRRRKPDPPPKKP